MNSSRKLLVADLLEGCKRSDPKAQELLYKVLAAKMLGVCMRYAKNKFEAEEMLQLGFIKVFNKINDFRAEGSFEGWIRRVMVNTAIEVYRKERKSLTVVDLSEDYDTPQSMFDMNNLEVKDLLTLVQELSDGYKLVFNLYAIEGYSHREISEQLGITEGASKSQLSRARAILREKINKMEGRKYEENVR